MTSYATPYSVSYLRFVRTHYVQASVMGRSLAKTLRKMSHCPKYSPQPVFPEVTAAIADAIVLQSAVSSGCHAVNSGCSAVNSGCRGAISQPRSLLPAKFGPRFFATSDVSRCPSVFSQPSLPHLFLISLAPTFLIRSHYLTSSSWRLLKSMLSSQAASSSF